ncbi:MAG TPA: hypothetical protein VN698_04970, partial [Bacteroidia bacterium]|nr:hypothetical protein [Bacteroidia bacterium]
SVYRGKVMRSDSASTADLDILISAVNKKTNEEITFTPNKNTGKYIMAMLPGTYKLNISAPGYTDYNETLVVFEFGVAKPETIKNYVLIKK